MYCSLKTVAAAVSSTCWRAECMLIWLQSLPITGDFYPGQSQERGTHVIWTHLLRCALPSLFSALLSSCEVLRASLSACRCLPFHGQKCHASHPSPLPSSIWVISNHLLLQATWQRTALRVTFIVLPNLTFVLQKWLSVEELMLSNCGAGEGSWESLGLPEDQTSQSQRKSTLNIHWKGWCWSSNTLATWCKESTHSKRPWFGERLEAKGEAGRGRDG